MLGMHLSILFPRILFLGCLLPDGFPFCSALQTVLQTSILPTHSHFSPLWWSVWWQLPKFSPLVPWGTESVVLSASRVVACSSVLIIPKLVPLHLTVLCWGLLCWLPLNPFFLSLSKHCLQLQAKRSTVAAQGKVMFTASSILSSAVHIPWSFSNCTVRTHNSLVQQNIQTCVLFQVIFPLG